MSMTLFRPRSTDWKPHNYQKEAVKFLLNHGAAGLFLDPGLGKTSIVLAALKLLLKAGTESKVLVVAPLLVAQSTWPGELEKWRDFKDIKMTVLHGPKKDKLLEQDSDIFVINPEGMDWLLDTTKTKSPRSGKTQVSVDVRRFKQMGFGTLVVDELTKFKNHQSDRFKAIKHVLPSFRRRWGLTGSPAANGLLQLFGQLYMLDLGRSLGEYVTHYQRKYFLPSYDGWGWVLQEGAAEQIYEAISPVVLRMSADQLLKDMPTTIVNRILVDLDEKTELIYLNMENVLVAALEDEKRIVAKTSGVAAMKCRQIASGTVFVTPDVVAELMPQQRKREWADLHDTKIQALAELIDELQGSPLLVGYEFTPDLVRLKKAFPKATFVSDYKPSDFRHLEDRWNSGEIDVMIAQSSTISHGLNLQGAGNHVAFFTVPWDFEVYDQFVRRVRRQGNKHKTVFVHHFLAKNTIDEVVDAMIEGKDKVQRAMFDGLQALRKMRIRQKS